MGEAGGTHGGGVALDMLGGLGDGFAIGIGEGALLGIAIDMERAVVSREDGRFHRRCDHSS